MNRRFGWIPDIPDVRDAPYMYTPPKRFNRTSDLSNILTWLYDQGDLGSCTAQGGATAHRFAQIKQGVKHVMLPSRLFAYWNARLRIGTTGEDSGAQIRDIFKSFRKEGVCSEARWKYHIEDFATKPTPACFEQALLHQGISMHRVEQTEAGIKGCLSEGFPVVYGFAVYESIADAERTGKIPMPKDGEELLGEHCVTLAGHDILTGKGANSWGRRWGNRGWFTMPLDYILNPDLCADFWTLRLVEV